MYLAGLRCESMKNPLGISILHPRLSWIIEGEERGIIQGGYSVTVRRDDPDSGRIVFESGEQEGRQNFIILADITLESRTRYYWDVRIRDDRGRTAISQEKAWFETGLLKEEDWEASWIEPEQKEVTEDLRGSVSFDEPKQSKEICEAEMNPCLMLRKEITLYKQVKKARAYATAHGIYRLLINGHRAGDYEFAPESTCYDDMLQVQTYDVTGLLNTGQNVIGAVIANGWWAGSLGNYGESRQYGSRLALLFQLCIEYEDGTEQTVGTDSTFRSSEGPWRYGELCIGEKYDMNLEKKGWTEAGYDDTLWNPVPVRDYGFENLTGQNAPHIRVLERICEPKLCLSPRGEKIIDFGQVMAGNACMHLKSAPGAVIRLHYFEETDREGNYWFELEGRNSQQTDTFVLDRTGEGDYDPWFTYHAFRYVWVESDKGEIDISRPAARLIASDMDVTAKIITSNRKVNRLSENIKWTLRSNLMSILTDNPDRERAGWTGDFQMIAPTLFYYVDAQAFVRRWMKETAFEQRRDGSIPLVVPNWRHYQNMPMSTSAGWGDVCVILPWIAYGRYGDSRILEENWPTMERWISYVRRRAEENPEGWGEMTPEKSERMRYLWNADFNFGDWLTPSACYDKETGKYTYFTQTLCYMMGTYYYAYSASIMAKAAAVLGMPEQEKFYLDLTEKIRKAAIEEIYKEGGILESGYMGAQVLALHMGFYPAEDRKKLTDRLVSLFLEKGMDTGFSSSLLISDALCESGYPELAYDILLNDRFPSWLYEVDQGATSVWESMQAVMPDGTRNAVSFIQPALCSIGNWMMQGMGGIRPLEPGFRRISVSPYFTERLSEVKAEYKSVQGLITCRWGYTSGRAVVEVRIPANTTANVRLPYAAGAEVRESGKKLSGSEGILRIKESDGAVELEISSGTYCFEYERNAEGDE